MRIGKDITVEELQKEYQAVYLAIGAHMGWELGVPGEDASNVMTGAAYLNLVNKGEAPEIGDKVVVIGGGDTAVDAARVSRRLGAKATIVYRRTRNEMPAIEPEIVATEQEDVELIYLAAPVEVLKDGDRATALKCQKCELGEPDASGRRRPVPIEGEFFEVPATFVVPAISQGPVFDGDLEKFKNEKGWIDVNEQHQTADGERLCRRRRHREARHRHPGDRPRPAGRREDRPQAPRHGARGRGACPRWSRRSSASPSTRSGPGTSAPTFPPRRGSRTSARWRRV